MRIEKDNNIIRIVTKNYIYFKQVQEFPYRVVYGVISCMTGRFLKSTEFPKMVDKYFLILSRA